MDVARGGLACVCVCVDFILPCPFPDDCNQYCRWHCGNLNKKWMLLYRVYELMIMSSPAHLFSNSDRNTIDSTIWNHPWINKNTNRTSKMKNQMTWSRSIGQFPFFCTHEWIPTALNLRSHYGVFEQRNPFPQPSENVYYRPFDVNGCRWW